MLVLSDEVACECVSFDEVEAAVREAFLALHAGDARLFDVVRAHGAQERTNFAIKLACNLQSGFVGAKIGSYAPDNASLGLPPHASTIVLFDAVTGAPRALIGAGRLNGMRTAAANALATRLLARPDSRVLGVLGAGHQAVCEAWAVCRVRPIEEVRFWAHSSRHCAAFTEQVSALTGIVPKFCECEQVVRAADVLVTVTPSRAPLFAPHWVRPGVHVAAMGADAEGKQELDLALLSGSRVFVDAAEQAVIIGECQHAVRAGLLTLQELRGRTLGALLAGAVAGREHAAQITVFDSSGIALQDLAVAELVLRRAAERADHVRVKMCALDELA